MEYLDWTGISRYIHRKIQPQWVCKRKPTKREQLAQNCCPLIPQAAPPTGGLTVHWKRFINRSGSHDQTGARWSRQGSPAGRRDGATLFASTINFKRWNFLPLQLSSSTFRRKAERCDSGTRLRTTNLPSLQAWCRLILFTGRARLVTAGQNTGTSA